MADCSSVLVLTTALLALVFAMLVAAAVLVVHRRRQRRKAVAIVQEGERGRPLPVVLVHGLFGFDSIGLPGARLDYFRGIARHLEQLGCDAHAVRLPGARSANRWIASPPAGNASATPLR